MRDLIKPTLFIVARLGLLLAVVAWIIGQWWMVKVSSQVEMSRRGWQYCNVLPMEARFSIWRKTEWHNLDVSITDFLSETPRTDVSFRGIEFRQYSAVRYLRVPHWLIVTIFALFYGVLKWVYRKRGKELAADE